MEKLYYKDQYIKEFTAEIVDIKEKDSKFYVELDKTAFFPGGGGQFCDTGKIDNHDVIDVCEENGTIYHITTTKPIKIHKVKCLIDWEKREDGMNQHFGQHVLSGCFFKLFNANTVGFHLGREFSTVDINGFLTEEQIRKAEEYANEIIKNDIEVEFLTPERKQLKKLGLRRDLPNTNEQIRVVKIGDLDINACCGVHPKSTLSLRMIKIKKYEKCRNATRIEFLAGKRAVDDSLKNDRYLIEICRYLSSTEKEAISGIKSLHNKLEEIMHTNKKLEEKISKYQIKEMIEEADKIGEISLIKKIYENENVKYISKMASKLVELDNVVALIALKNDDKSNFVFASSKNISNLNMSELIKDAITLVDGRGGGSQFLAQGGGKDNGNIESLLNYAQMKIERTLNK
ncbi:alanyl-tRNA synthetase [[Clostridium] sordellii]|uniref:Alanyl-tRNA synthetase n=1 Tax=Paraclostridium sordellii TaxID=1505 RepID=A0ABM9RML9_PARSO|nr:DHHA1 domain-containing protein [Paeniclostridium sordellii]CEJ73289.1 putative alanyl-tRNA synthetase [[Clostridium] sordellii] [Paeniclostridium sordellii]CEN68842.1 alanyl-tRNA synthetase [[Clostridium] sordellii] [Paeniclostridium sordellii]CEN72109.1 alanyl-tRNA synthetase [[Clostridium] sordellii] [Paeniclostridium sordellii]CEO23143.1 alanyl-tRNA synthetase [[Clostridium] sordellii] [Paeniclostridium sordellii]CEP76298.1 alanyl-tRNA synthetase [[Clostridium] sordellii] [Paeniclostrid